MDVSANRKVVLDFLAAMDTGDGPAAMAALAEDATWTVVGHGLPVSGTMTKAQLCELLAKEADVYDGPLRITPMDTTAEGRRIAVEATAHGTVKRTGRAYDNTYHFLFVVDDDGRIAEVKEYMDTHHWAETVGGSVSAPAPSTGDSRWFNAFTHENGATMTDPNLSLAEAFYRSLLSGDIAECERMFGDDAVVWHNFTLLEQSPRDALAQAAAFSALNAEFELTERVLLTDGWLQQHRFHFPFADGAEILAAIQRVRVADGLIARIDEYMDTGQLGRIGQKAQAASGA